MAYTAPKWTQMTAPSGTTSVNALTSAGDLFSKAMDSASEGLKSYDKGVESRLQEDSDVNTAALRRRLESATDLDSLNAMQGDISATGLEGYGKRIDADALSQSFDKERGVLRGEFEQEYNEDFSQRLNQAKTPAEYELIRQSMATNPKYFDDASRITALGAGTDKAIQTQTDQSVLKTKIGYGGSSYKDLKEQKKSIDETVPGAAENLVNIDAAMLTALKEETSQFAETVAQLIQKAETSADFTEIKKAIANKSVENPDMDMSKFINAQGELKNNLEIEADRVALNTLSTKVTSNENLSDLEKQLTELNKNPGVDNFKERQSLLTSQISKVKSLNETIATNTLQSELSELSYSQLNERTIRLDKSSGQYDEQFKLIDAAKKKILADEQETYDRNAEQKLRDAALLGPKEYKEVKKELQLGQSTDSNKSLLDTGVIKTLDAELKKVAVSNGSNSVITNVITKQQDLFSNNDKAFDAAIDLVTNAKEYVTKDSNGQYIFSVDMPAQMKQRVLDEAEKAGYSPPPKGLVDTGAFIEELVNVQKFERVDAERMAAEANQTLFSKFNSTPAVKEKIDQGVAAANATLQENLAIEEKTYAQVEKLKDFSNNEISQLVGDPEVGVIEWGRANIKSGGFLEPTWGQDFEEIEPEITDIISNGITYRGKFIPPSDIPKNVIKLVLSRFLGPNQTVNIDNWDLKKAVFQQLENTDDIAALERHITGYKNYTNAVKKHKIANSTEITVLTTNAQAEGGLRRAVTAKPGTVPETEFVAGLRTAQEKLAEERRLAALALQTKLNGSLPNTQVRKGRLFGAR